MTVFPFDLFGSAGTGAGAKLLVDAVNEILDDTEAETRPCRADVLRGNVRVQEFAFDTVDAVAGWRKTGRRAAKQALRAKEFSLWLGGNHLAALPALEELGPDTLVVQFDAHLDVYAFHDTTSELSHGNFLTHFEAPRPRLVNVGHRDLFLTADEISATFETVYPAWEVAADVARVASALREKVQGAKRVWIDLDCDVFDPSVLPAVAEPLPFGLFPHAFLALFAAVWSGNVVGMSVSEFDPGRDVRDTGLNLLGWLVEYTLLAAAER
ncbi:arginase family protein [Gemmata sp. JC717]|uniref:arginase family protein n=1 Tax=Gemmata algarum TaxID=2975278 RepID=UPI0021BA9E68|nr:arginase family protein [Gemmata algarum]MDY3557271.1 arginase family protein [Gemmata algarum]